MARERTETGEFVETITQDRVLAAIRDADAPIVTTRDVADALDCTTEAARQKLIRLTDQGRVERRKVGGRAVVWWIEDSPLADDRMAVEERPAATIIEDLEAFLEDRETPESPVSVPTTEAGGVHGDYHARRHRENLEKLATGDKDE